MEFPTFDEWFEKKHHASFEEVCGAPGVRHDDYLRALSQHTREYVSEMVQEIANGR